MINNTSLGNHSHYSYKSNLHTTHDIVSNTHHLRMPIHVSTKFLRTIKQPYALSPQPYAHQDYHNLAYQSCPIARSPASAWERATNPTPNLPNSLNAQPPPPVLTLLLPAQCRILPVSNRLLPVSNLLHPGNNPPSPRFRPTPPSSERRSLTLALRHPTSLTLCLSAPHFLATFLPAEIV